VYWGKVIRTIGGTIANGAFDKGENVLITMALTQSSLDSLVSERLKKWRSECGGDWVLTQDDGAQEQAANRFADEILKDIRNYDVYFIDTKRKRDYQTSVEGAAMLVKRDENGNKLFPGMTPEMVVDAVVNIHNSRVF